MEELKTCNKFILDLIDIVIPQSIAFDYVIRMDNKKRFNLRSKITKSKLQYAQFHDYSTVSFKKFINSAIHIEKLDIICYENQIIYNKNATHSIFGLNIELLQHNPENKNKCYVSIQDNKITQWI